MSSNLWAQIRERRKALEDTLQEHLAPIARQSARHWHDLEALDALLSCSLTRVPGCHLLYATDKRGRLVSGNAGPDGLDPQVRGQDLSARPFLDYAPPFGEIAVSDVYISRITRRSCVTAIYRIHTDRVRVVGYLAADFDLSALQLPGEAATQSVAWRQIRGDPSIRAGLFQQCRTDTLMDRHIDEAHDIAAELLCNRGIFQIKLYYSAARATLWLDADPRRYRVHVLNEILNPAVCLAYPTRPYPADATVPPDQVAPVLTRFRQLRQSDSTLYLRSGSLNLVNGLVCLNFSCDGTHYMPAAEFVERPAAFWFG